MPEREKADLLHAGSLSRSSGLVIIEQRRALPDVQVIQVPAPIAAGPEYGLAILSGGKPAAARLAFAILSPEGQATLARFGFDPVGLPAGAPAK
jgi:Bacterial extracellular solute-binding protein